MLITSKESIKLISSIGVNRALGLFNGKMKLTAASTPFLTVKRNLGTPSKVEEFEEFEEQEQDNNKEDNKAVLAPNEMEIKEGKESMFPGIARATDLIMSSGKGLYVTDIYGKKYLDFTSGIGALSTGYSHPKVTSAVVEQVNKLVHAQVSVAYHEKMFQLFSKMKKVFPSSLDSYFLWNSGAEAVEASIKLARHATKKPNIISFNGGYHGRTYGAMSLTTSKTIYSAGFGPLPSGVFSTPFPYSSQMPKGISDALMSDYCIEEFERTLHQKTAPSDTAAVIVETVLGEGGYVVPPKDFLPRLQKICKKNDILLILDEVQTGFGRTGKMFAFEHFGVVPDIAVIAKGMGSGYPISGIATRKELSKTQPPGSMGGTYAGNPMVCSAAIATLEVFEEEKLVENAFERGKQLSEGLQRIRGKGKFPIKDIRGLGLMQAIEFDETVPKGTATDFTKEILKEDMLLLTTSMFETLRFIPSLTVSKLEVDIALEKVEKVMMKMFSK